MNKYMSIVRLGHKSTVGVLNVGDEIVVQEKLDGANASFKVGEDGAILAFSRNLQLDEHNTLRGFYPWAQSLNAENLTPGRIYFGEWLVRHKLDYGDNANRFYLFDIFDESTGEYLPFDVVKSESTRLNLNLVPLLYEGAYRSFDHLQSFVGKSVLGEVGEGVVVKNVNYKDRFGSQMFVKLVSDAFREVQPQKAAKDPVAKSEAQIYIEQFLTTARVEKLLLKLVDEDVLQEPFGVEDMGIILKNLNVRAFEDIAKEESESIPEGVEEKDIRKAVSRSLPYIVRSVIKERENIAA